VNVIELENEITFFSLLVSLDELLSVETTIHKILKSCEWRTKDLICYLFLLCGWYESSLCSGILIINTCKVKLSPLVIPPIHIGINQNWKQENRDKWEMNNTEPAKSRRKTRATNIKKGMTRRFKNGDSFIILLSKISFQ
jgi:hypothetical protein